jgi:hypothetical protein
MDAIYPIFGATSLVKMAKVFLFNSTFGTLDMMRVDL